MSQQLNLELGLAPHDPWALKKNLSDSDLRYGASLFLPSRDIEPIIQEMGIENLESGVEVKLHIIEEGHDSDDYTLTLLKTNQSKYVLRGWYDIAKAKGYKTNDEIGLMWDNGSGRFLFHHIK